jgi:hypothetical protein
LTIFIQSTRVKNMKLTPFEQYVWDQDLAGVAWHQIATDTNRSLQSVELAWRRAQRKKNIMAQERASQTTQAQIAALARVEVEEMYPGC